MAPRHLRGLILFALVCALSAASCRDPAEPERDALRRVAVVQLLDRAADVVVGDTVRLSLLHLPMLPPGYVPPVSWSSSDPGTATVQRVGPTAATVRGIRAGQAVITAAGEGASDSAVITVVEPAP